MKKSIKAELVLLANKILKLQDNSDYALMANHARHLQEKLTVLAYAEKLEKRGDVAVDMQALEKVITEVATQPTETQEEIASQQDYAEPILKSKTPAEIRAENQARFTEARATDSDHHRPDGTQFNQEDPVHEPVIEKIKDMWPEMAPEAAAIDEVIASILPEEPAVGKNDSFEIGNEYGQMPIFEPKEMTAPAIDDTPKNLNDRLKSGTFKIGLNDKLSFIKHLFGGSAADYNRVLSQLETFETFSEAQQFIAQMVKPDYNNWEGKEPQEERFMEILERRYA